MKIFDADFRQGNLIDKVNQVVPVNTGPVVIKNTEKGRAAYFNNAAILDYGINPDWQLDSFSCVINFRVLNLSDNINIFILHDYDFSGDKGWMLQLSAANLFFYVGSSPISVNTNANDKKWHQVILTKNGTDGKIYLDNELVKEDTLDATITYTDTGLLLGKRSDASQYLDGHETLVRLYNSILTTRERENLYQEFLHSYPIQKSVINVAKLRPVATFDGVDDYVDISSIGNLSGAFTLSFWCNLLVNGQYIFGETTNSDYIVISTTSVAVKINDNYDSFATSAISLNKMNYIVLTRNGSNDVKLYINNVNITPNLSLSGNFDLNYIGRRVNTYGNIEMADVWMFGEELSVSQVAQLYKTGQVASLEIAHWKLDEGSGLIAHDSSPNGNDGTINAIGNDFWQQTRGKLAANDAFVSEDLTNQNAEGVTTAAGKFLGDWKVATGSFRCKEDSTGKYIDCVTNGTIQLRGIDLSELVGNGYVKELEGDLSGDADGTVDDATNLSFADNILTVSMTAGQVLRKLIITRGA